MENKRMVANEEQRRSPRNQKVPLTDSNGQNMATLFSPRFKSAAAMAGWDEEALLLASLIVEDTPDRDPKHKKRYVLHSKTPPNSSRAQRSPQAPIPVVLDLDAEETPKIDSGRKKKEKKACVENEGKKACVENEGSKVGEGGNESKEKNPGDASSSSSLPCIDKLRDELSCAICLEICFEPSTTPCGHSFCRKCLRSAADKCGKKCPKCRQLISNGRSCTVNTVLWNTIQLLFPQEVEARKEASALNSRQQAQNLSPESAFFAYLRNDTQPLRVASSRSTNSMRSGTTATTTTTTTTTTSTQENEDAALARMLQREIDEQRSLGTTRTRLARLRARRGGRGVSTSQHEDAALALRMQREEFMQTYRGSSQEQSSRLTSTSLARENLRAMASRAMNRRR
ncbi:LON peptidase N-terminal domain and RING finger protein 3-like isoform X2 [Glycine soja]|uniref:LON peptidase N-terminal domain and RING finger protein 3-like isoform X2 n=1 Tax=Glycine soja TaxID=3848 RepID=UPI0010390CA7|nr:LON peptidase N-terminal domain and RING finger protein 3-like isoform X2 [Glycine soja]